LNYKTVNACAFAKNAEHRNSIYYDSIVESPGNYFNKCPDGDWELGLSDREIV
jgi:hypothetical protein